MTNRFYYIEPSALHLNSKEIKLMDMSRVQTFIDCFQEMLETLYENGNIKLIIDDLLYEFLQEEDTPPIPILLSDISDSTLRKKVAVLQDAFFKLLPPMVIDLPASCKCESNSIFLDRDSVESYEKSHYYFWLFLRSIIMQCESMKTQNPQNILTIKEFSMFPSAAFKLRCVCGSRSVSDHFTVVDYRTLIDNSYKAKKILKHLINSIDPSKSNDVEVIQSPHEAIFPTIAKHYSDIPCKFRDVLNILLKFGLYKIHFHEWEKRPANLQSSSIIKCDSCSYLDSDCDIIEGKLVLEERLVKVHLYFPVQVGVNIINAVGSDFIRVDIEKLATDVC